VVAEVAMHFAGMHYMSGILESKPDLAQFICARGYVLSLSFGSLFTRLWG
jgi:hypothetical protein